MANVINLFEEKGRYDIEYIKNSDGKVVAISHPDWSFDIVKNENETAFVCKNTDEPFGILPSDIFNTVLMSWLLIDDPDLIDSAAYGGDDG